MKSSNMSWKFRIVCIESQRTKDRNVQKSSQADVIKNTLLPNSKCSMGRIHLLCINLITAFFSWSCKKRWKGYMNVACFGGYTGSRWKCIASLTRKVRYICKAIREQVIYEFKHFKRKLKSLFPSCILIISGCKPSSI